MTVRRPNRALRLVVIVALAVVAAACIPAPVVEPPAPPPPPAGPVPALDADNPDARNPFGWMEGGREWRGDFPDPHILRDGDTYFAYATNAAGRYMPVLQSKDLVTWTSPPRYTTAAAPWLGGGDPHVDPAIPAEIRTAGLDDGDTWNLNDGLVKPPVWAVPRSTAKAGCSGNAPGGTSATGLEGRSLCSLLGRGGKTSGQVIDPVLPQWTKNEMWGPGVIKIGSRFYAYSAVKVGSPRGVEYGRFCLTVARSSSPRGPFRDISGSEPILCDVDPGGSIDPYPFRDPNTGEYWLYWKATGNGGSPGNPTYPSSLKAMKLISSGERTGFPLGGANGVISTLLKTKAGTWEGFSIENPSMVYWQKRYWLFYSGNKFIQYPNGTSKYAQGYAVCDGPAGPCRRTTTRPLVSSTVAEVGPGGGSVIVDRSGRLRLAMHYFWPGDQREGGTPRRFKVLTIGRKTPDLLAVVR